METPYDLELQSSLDLVKLNRPPVAIEIYLRLLELNLIGIKSQVVAYTLFHES